MRCARPLNRDASERTSRKDSREPVVWKAGSALEPLESTGDLSTARMPPPNCIERVIASTQCGHVGLRLPSRYGPTLTKIACSCLSKGIRAGDVLPAAVRARRTRLRTESGMLSGDNNSKSVTLVATDKKTVILSEVLPAQSLPCQLSCPYKHPLPERNSFAKVCNSSQIEQNQQQLRECCRRYAWDRGCACGASCVGGTRGGADARAQRCIYATHTHTPVGTTLLFRRRRHAQASVCTPHHTIAAAQAPSHTRSTRREHR